MTEVTSSGSRRGHQNPLAVTRYAGIRIEPDLGRVITKPFLPGDVAGSAHNTRIQLALSRILAMDEPEVETLLALTTAEFSPRHRRLGAVLGRSVDELAQRVSVPTGLSTARRELIGAYFTQEYAIEAAALSNPSMVAAPDQSGLAPGETRFVMSLRAIGEGHVSCIEFRSGVIDGDLAVTVEPPTRYAATGTRSGADYDKSRFRAKLAELGALNAASEAVLVRVGSTFSLMDLEAAMGEVHAGVNGPLSTELHLTELMLAETMHLLHWLASSSYRLSFAGVADLSERVIFPGGPTESSGMEDLRLVRFVEEDGELRYYGTYTAFDGHQILPQLIETADFMSFSVSTLSGRSAQNKGIALFPRRVHGQFLALGRHDNVNNFLMVSGDVRVWHEAELIQQPKRPWELLQLGNCGSPLETEAGWLVITHGVGPMRRYSLGALLLDLDEPSRVIGHLAEPLLAPSPDERDGYVPNVVYSCGSMIHGDHLVLPYGFADVGARIATVALADLLERLVP